MIAEIPLRGWIILNVATVMVGMIVLAALSLRRRRNTKMPNLIRKLDTADRQVLKQAAQYHDDYAAGLSMNLVAVPEPRSDVAERVQRHRDWAQTLRRIAARE